MIAAVVPNRDGAGVLDRCLDALVGARGVDEIVVVDDGSTDGSDRAAAAREPVRVLQSRGRGFAAAANTGAAATSGDLLLLVNSDAFVREDTAERLAAALDADSRLGVCSAALVREDGSRAKTHDRLLGLREATLKALSVVPPRLPEGRGVARTAFVPLACALIRREAWHAVGGLDERFGFYFEDHDLAWRLTEAGWWIAVDWDAEAVHLEGGSSRARSPQTWFVTFHESRLRYLRKRYSRSWALYAAAWVPSAAAHSALWLGRAARRDRRDEALAWARAYACAAVAGLRY